MRILIRPRLPVLALLLFAPAIPELLTGSTPISRLWFDPFGFAVSFGLDIGLYGTGALLIREFVVNYRRGWASVLALGAAYGIAEEGFAVHTFFERSGTPVGLLGSYGHAFGVNWLWALGLTVFHATYSIALPVLLVGLWFPAVRGVRWLDRGSVGVVAAIYVAEVAVFAHLVGQGPSPAAFAFFLVVVAALIGFAAWAPADLLSPRPGPARSGRLGLFLAGTLGFDAWVLVLIATGIHRLPAVVPAGAFVAIDLGALAFVLRRVGGDGLEVSEFFFATGMLAVLWVWDVLLEFSIPGILVVAAVFALLQYRLGRRVLSRAVLPGGPGGPTVGGPAAPPTG